MAAPLTDQGRFPTIQTVPQAGYDNFIEVCAQSPKPTAKLVALMATLKHTEKSGPRK